MKTLAAAPLVLTGCLVVPATTTTARQVATATSDVVQGRVERVALAARADQAAVFVRTIAARTCSRDVVNVYAVRTSAHLEYHSPDDPRAKLFALLVAPLTLPVSLVVSTMAAPNDEVHTRTAVDHTEHYACTTVAPRTDVSIELPSGAKAREVTDDRGELTFPIPPSEPYEGSITVHLAQDGATLHQVAYHRFVPPLVAARAALAACGAADRELRLNIDERGYLAGIAIGGDARGELAACVGPRLAGQHFPYESEHVVLPLGPGVADDSVTRIAPVCASVDAASDQLAEPERAAAKLALARVLEAQDQLVVDTGCDDTFALWHEREAAGFVVHLRSNTGQRRLHVRDAAGLPGAYARLAAALITDARFARERAAADAAKAAQAAAAAKAVATAPVPSLGEPERADAPAAPATVAADGGDFARTPLPPTMGYVRGGFGSGVGAAVGVRYRTGSAVMLDGSLSGVLVRNTTQASLDAKMLLLSRPHSDHTWFYGFGLGAASTQVDGGSGYGVQGELAVGYEAPAGSNGARWFLETDLGLPAYRVDMMDSTADAPTTLMFSIGIGSKISPGTPR
ncbi:MAG: hypothetical protein ACM31C_24420 [Acidobacteriota bacterium]